jgi:WD40-like Beta Propeller Repeat
MICAMLLRLLKLETEFQTAALRLPGLLVLALFVACGGKHFSASPDASDVAGSGGSSASAGAGDTTALGGDSGSSSGDAGSSSGGEDTGGTGATGGANPTAGSAGKGATGCAACTAGMYCQDGVNKCRPCSDFSRLEFAAPEPLSTLSHGPGSVERFPRSAGTGSALFYTEDGVARRAIWYTAAPTSGIGDAIQGSSGALLGNDSGPLLAPGFADKNFFFDRAQVVTDLRKIMVGNWSGGTLSLVTPATEPTNVDGSSDYSFAAAPSAGHAYWMSTRSGAPQLIWESINEMPMVPPDVLPLKIRIGGNKGCDRLGDDATPWVNLAGTLLLFSAESMADTCQPNDSHAHDLFAVPLAKTGLPASAAIPLSALNNTGGGSDETDPSLSPDSCSVYFASDNGTGNYDLYRAARN